MSANHRDDSSFYEVLEISPTASGRDIHSAYTRAKETYAPGSPALYTMFTTEEARELLKMIEEAFTTLSNQSKRAEYDMQLARNGHPAFSELLKKAPASSYGPAPIVNPTPAQLKKTPSATPERKPIIAGDEGAVLKGVRPPMGSPAELPDGFARTKFGVYEINPSLEHEFTLVEECDGSFIQKVRQYKKLTFEQLSESTRISKSYLAALESNAYDALPAPVFVRGFVLQIARTLGVPDRLADAYMKHFRKQIGS